VHGGRGSIVKGVVAVAALRLEVEHAGFDRLPEPAEVLFDVLLELIL
jgi:hypothetical protein